MATHSLSLPRLALVPGEPAGVGPELALALATRPINAVLVAFADPALLRDLAKQLDLPVRITEVDARHAAAHVPGELAVLPLPAGRPAAFGHPNPFHAPWLLRCFQQAAESCLAGHFDAVVTGPVQKASFHAAGIPFVGVTELMAAAAGGCDVVMMLANPRLRVALATTHLPLRAVPDAITAPLLERVLGVLHGALRRDFGIGAPRIAVLGLNPHAGEQGNLGREEIEVIAPVLTRLRAAGMDLDGPLPADTAFLPQRLEGVDAVLAMYHDQGLPVLKHSGFEDAVNITLGLPFPRVAVDHGTALDLAGTGRANPKSLATAIEIASSMVRTHRAPPTPT